MKTTTVFATAYNADMLEAIFSMNEWKETEITCPDGTVIAVSPCYYGEAPATREAIEYYLVYSDIPWNGCDSLEKLAKKINGHAEAVAELDKERKELRAYFEAHERNGWDSDSWSWYSDWHKDLYGYRPHGHVCGEYVEPYKGACLSDTHKKYR